MIGDGQVSCFGQSQNRQRGAGPRLGRRGHNHKTAARMLDHLKACGNREKSQTVRWADTGAELRLPRAFIDAQRGNAHLVASRDQNVTAGPDLSRCQDGRLRKPRAARVRNTAKRHQSRHIVKVICTQSAGCGGEQSTGAVLRDRRTTGHVGRAAKFRRAQKRRLSKAG